MALLSSTQKIPRSKKETGYPASRSSRFAAISPEKEKFIFIRKSVMTSKAPYDVGRKTSANERTNQVNVHVTAKSSKFSR
jgi:hypothetical protein